MFTHDKESRKKEKHNLKIAIEEKTSDLPNASMTVYLPRIVPGSYVATWQCSDLFLLPWRKLFLISTVLNWKGDYVDSPDAYTD